MRVACLGGGPAGLYLAISLKLRQPAHEVVVVERNRPYDTFGWGVVLSNETLDNLDRNDPLTAATIRDSFVYWDDIAVHYRGQVLRSGGHGFSGIGRRRLLNVLQDRARELGVELRFETEIEGLASWRDWDLVVGADGVNSKVRTELAHVFKPDIDVRACKYIWLGTNQKFDAFTFVFEETPHGWVWAHAYQFDADTATFIVECSEDTWRRSGFDRMDGAETVAACERIFANYLGGHPLMTNARHLRGSGWLNFNRVLCERWSHENVVLLGDAAATAHFSIGSGTKLAMESAIALAEHVDSEPDLASALARYEAERRVEVLKLQSAARNSVEWFENVERYLHLDPVQLNYSLLTRSQRIGHENLRQRDPRWLASAEAWFETTATGKEPAMPRAPMFVPFRVREVELANRVVVSPMDQYPSGGWHAGRLAFRPLRGARQGRRRARHDRDDLRHRRGPHQSGLHGPLSAGARAGLGPHRGLHPHRDRRESRHSARALRPEGLDAAGLGDDGCAARRRELGGDCAVASAVVAGQPDPPCHDSRRHGRGARRVRGFGTHGGARRFRLAGVALRARLSAVGVHHAAHQPSRRRVWRHAREPAALSAGSAARGAGGVAGWQADLGAHLGARLGGRGRHHAK